MKDLRIASFLPAATEMVCALGLQDNLVGVSHECDFPPEVRSKPIVVRCAIELSTLDLVQIDKAVSERVGQGGSVYVVDEKAVRAAAPNLIITQDLCQVCAPSGNEATQVLNSMVPKPDILWQSPHSFEDVLKDLLTLGRETGTLPLAEKLAAEARRRIKAIVSLTRSLPPVKVFFVEWVDPLFCGGHWIPEMLEWAGGRDELAKKEVDSIRVPWEDILRMDPELLIVSPCGYGTEDALKQAGLLKTKPGWNDLAAVKKNQVYAVDGNAYFARPGLRLVEGVELLAHLLHPETFPWKGPAGAFAQLQAVR